MDKPVVLIADDDRTARHLMDVALTKQGYNTVLAEDGAHALHLAHKHKIDVMLIDIYMPVLDGIEVLEIIRKSDEFWDIPVLLITATSSRNLLQNALEKDANDFITKPIKVGSLRKRVANNMIEFGRGNIRQFLSKLKKNEQRFLDPKLVVELEKVGKAPYPLRYQNLNICILIDMAETYKSISGMKDHELESKVAVIAKTGHFWTQIWPRGLINPNIKKALLKVNQTENWEEAP